MNSLLQSPVVARLKLRLAPLLDKVMALPAVQSLYGIHRRFVWRTWMAVPVAAVLTIAGLVAFHHIRYQSFRYEASGTATSFEAIRQQLNSVHQSLAGLSGDPAGAAVHIAIAAGDLQLANEALSSVEAWSNDDAVLRPLYAGGATAKSLHAHDATLLDTARGRITAATQQIAQARFVHNKADAWSNLAPPGNLALPLVPGWSQLASSLTSALGSGDIDAISAAAKGLTTLQRRNPTCVSLENALPAMSPDDQLAGRTLIRSYGTALASHNTQKAEDIFGQITLATTTLGQAYQVVLAHNGGVMTGIVRQAPGGDKHYYLVVLAQDAGGKAVQLDMPDSEHGITQMTSIYAVEVPKSIYDRYYRASLRSARDGVPQVAEVLGEKTAKGLAVKYTIPVLDRTLAFSNDWQHKTP